MGDIRGGVGFRMDEANALILVVALVVLFVFFLPSLIAYQRGSRHRFIILVLNCTLAFTGLGWLAIFIFAVWPRNDALPVRLVDGPSKNGGASGNPDHSSPSGGDPSGPPASDPVSRLTDLAELKRAGVLSDAEFDHKKQEILSA
jgi:Superinfection immunity protein/Short C-terminal domain